jgi:hypothetical protein
MRLILFSALTNKSSTVSFIEIHILANTTVIQFVRIVLHSKEEEIRHMDGW